ncbi:SusC/RagA family TonB-linked outer membrane protein [Leeuwenhoekiella palythoae]|uniref:TonB-linked SusC/RagA family outer membrane protein n=1 Tax=Leeuwenhoekiella palythoae TaxID=573501 RepID=A0A1M5ZP30_9FLAO|nr:SusC/RagA family TonB-linked outer membrane protein [Leeuwenhoekiella palythoae]RXG27254.1 TonB-linked SusC/RagA family outer membrane protein [Leeuwenhoekiella palythoae]SHI25663.1 TonB-linked outer membrane protein, SusC/RagA family [Leeuwenhoekiella palythoae]
MKSKITWCFALGLLFLTQLTFAQQKTVTGTVTDGNSMPLPGVNIVVQGTSVGTQTDFDGNYSISAEQGQNLVFSYIGFQDQVVAVGASSTISVSMQAGEELDEVVVTGFGNVSKTSFTGSAKVVEGEQISKKSFTNVSQALAGEAAGVSVFNTTGQPGSTSTIRIRGFGSINGSQAPLYVVDDAPFGGSLNDINPNDIKSVTVLKDASATSLYGARGANGVIVITTKKGKGRNNLNVSIKTGTNYQGIKRYETIKSPEEYIGIAWEGTYQRGLLENDGDQGAAIDYANANLFEGANADVSDISPVYNMWNIGGSDAAAVAQLIDPATATVRPGVTRRYSPERWEDFAFQSSNRTEANVSLSNSGENSSVYASFGYVDDVGYANNTDYKRLNGRVTATNNVLDIINSTTTINYAQSEQNVNGTSEDSGSQFWWIDNLPTIYPLYQRDAAGNRIPDPIYGGFLFDYGLEDGRGFGFATNGVADSEININKSKANSINFNNDLKIDIVDGLTFENNFGYQYFMSEDIDLNERFYSPAKGEGGRVSRARSETKNYTIRTGLRYAKQFGDFNLSAFLSHVATGYEFNYLFASRSNLVTSFGTDIRNGVINNPSDGFTREEKTESYIANVTLDFANKYYLNGTFNRDASSRFVNEKWGNFYAIGGAWILSQEDFLQNSSAIDFLKLKASYGVIGNSDTDGSYGGLYPGYNIYSINNLNNNISLAFTTRGNPDLTWESSNQFNVGAEFELFNFVDASVEYYRKSTTDMFFSRNVAPSNGFAVIQVNDGEMLNSGVEFDLDFSLVKSPKFKLNLGINGQLLDNELVALPIDPTTGEEQRFDQEGSYGRTAGRSLYDWYMPIYAGVNIETGAAQWERYFDDVDNDGTFGADDVVITSLTGYMNDNPDANIVQDITEVYAEAADRFVDKTAIPDITGSFRLNAEYGAFSLSALFAYSLGGWSYDGAYANLMDNDYAGTNNFHVDIRDRWMSPGDVTDIPRQDARFQIQQSATSTRFLTKSDFLALNNIRLGYTMPTSFVEKMGLANLDLFLSGDNLALWSKRNGFNPSTSVTGNSSIYRYNPLSTIVFGVNLTL